MALELSGKTIIILSPQSWGKMFISKHHYAIELAKRGNKVYFLNPPEQEGTGFKKITIQPSGVVANLFLIHHALWFPYRLKFHALPLFHLLMKGHIRAILKQIGPVDIIWSFDLGNLYPFRLWGNAPFKIFHPVDEPLNNAAIEAAAGCDVIFSVTKEILEKYKSFAVPRHFVNHGVSSEFLYNGITHKGFNGRIRVGVAGNLLRNDLDRNVMLQIVQENPAVTFECWGSYSLKQSSIGGGEDAATKSFIACLQSLKNVQLHGAIPSTALAAAVQEMDAFLICYDVEKDQSKGTNYHKIIEFLATGKVIVSNNVTTYQDRPDLICMVNERNGNYHLPGLFKEVINNLAIHNSEDRQFIRKSFAWDHTYAKQVGRIESFLN